MSGVAATTSTETSNEHDEACSNAMEQAMAEAMAAESDKSGAREMPDAPEVECLAPLTSALSAGKMIDIANLVVNDNGDIELLNDTRSCGFRFELGGVPVHVGMRTDGAKIRLTLSGDLGYLPYSIENHEARHAINAVIAATDDLTYSKFELVDSQHIMLRGHRHMPRPFQLVDMFAGLVEMIHEINPFMELLGDCLDRSQSDIPVPGYWKPLNPSVDPADEMIACKKRALHQTDAELYGIAAE